MKTGTITPFTIKVAPNILGDLRQRLKNTRWSYQTNGTNWDAGTDLDYLRELVAYWLDAYDWRKHEANLKMPSGGHFAAMEEPELLAEDLRTWFRSFRDTTATR